LQKKKSGRMHTPVSPDTACMLDPAGAWPVECEQAKPPAGRPSSSQLQPAGPCMRATASALHAIRSMTQLSIHDPSIVVRFTRRRRARAEDTTISRPPGRRNPRQVLCATLPSRPTNQFDEYHGFISQQQSGLGPKG